MRILVAPNSFKESLDSHRVARHIRIGLRRASRKFVVVECPLSDGGTGFHTVITKALTGKFVRSTVSGPLDRMVAATYGYVPQQKTAVVELAEAAGLRLVAEEKRNPMISITQGVGELIMSAVTKGCKRIIVGIGDSATIDCGVGALSVLGFRFLNRTGTDIELNCRGLLDLVSIDDSRVNKALRHIKIIVASDVENVLTGAHGALVYARQKGAKSRQMPMIDKALKNFRKVTRQRYGIDLNKVPGSGAAGGIGGALRVLLNAEIRSGFEIVKQVVCLEDKIRQSDIVITGEGTIDEQTFYGKVPRRVVDIAHRHRKPVVFIAGQIKKKARLFDKHGVVGYYSIMTPSVSRKRALQDAPQLLGVLAFSVGKKLLGLDRVA